MDLTLDSQRMEVGAKLVVNLAQCLILALGYFLKKKIEFHHEERVYQRNRARKEMRRLQRREGQSGREAREEVMEGLDLR